MFDISPLETRIAELERRLNNVLRPGTISEADYGQARVKVIYGDNTTGWLPWITRRAGATATDWWAPEVGEQVLVLSPGGNPAHGVVLPALYSTANKPASDDPKVRRLVFDDGSSIEYSATSHTLTVNVTAGGKVSLTAEGNIDVKAGGDANVTADGNVNVKGASVAVDGDTITLNQGDKGGVVCQLHTCSFTGSPHPEASTTVSAGA